MYERLTRLPTGEIYLCFLSHSSLFLSQWKPCCFSTPEKQRWGFGLPLKIKKRPVLGLVNLPWEATYCRQRLTICSYSPDTQTHKDFLACLGAVTCLLPPKNVAYCYVSLALSITNYFHLIDKRVGLLLPLFLLTFHLCEASLCLYMFRKLCRCDFWCVDGIVLELPGCWAGPEVLSSVQAGKQLAENYNQRVCGPIHLHVYPTQILRGHSAITHVCISFVG